jgi:hypothetical protein
VWWMVFKDEGGRYVWIEEANNLMAARLKASLAGQTDGFVEGHQLTEKMAGKLPKGSVQKRLDMAAAGKLLAKLG